MLWALEGVGVFFWPWRERINTYEEGNGYQRSFIWILNDGLCWRVNVKVGGSENRLLVAWGWGRGCSRSWKWAANPKTNALGTCRRVQSKLQRNASEALGHFSVEKGNQHSFLGKRTMWSKFRLRTINLNESGLCLKLLSEVEGTEIELRGCWEKTVEGSH